MTSSVISPPYPSPKLRHRLVCMIYEALLIFGVVFFVGAVHDIATGSRDPSMHQTSRIALIFLICGAYFIYFWRKNGQTLAMQTWRIMLVNDDCTKVPLIKCLVRYCLCWLWFLPSLAVSHQLKLNPGQIGIAVTIGFCSWACTVFLNKDHQFLHDVFAKTRLIQIPKPEPKTEPAV